MRSFAQFAAQVPNRELFQVPQFVGDMEAEAYNEWTLCLWAVWLGRIISHKTKRKLKVGTIEQRISLFKGLLQHRYGFALTGGAPRLKRLLDTRRQGSTDESTRRKRRGLRRRHLRRIWRKNAHVRKDGEAEQSEWAALTTAWHVLARGGELGGVTEGDLEFGTERNGRRYACVWLRPLKKKRGANQPKIPQYVREQPGQEWEPYAALKRLRATRQRSGIDPKAPLFRTRSGRAMSTGAYRALVKRVGRLGGIDPKKLGAHSTRIGGATDLASAAAEGGDDMSAAGASSELLLQAKGRWQSDIGKIYARMTRRMHLAASDLMHRGRGRDLEELLPEFTQPA